MKYIISNSLIIFSFLLMVAGCTQNYYVTVINKPSTDTIYMDRAGNVQIEDFTPLVTPATKPYSPPIITANMTPEMYRRVEVGIYFKPDTTKRK